jgi:hypothetical protein
MPSMVIIWAIMASAISMALYKKISPQQKIAALKLEQRESRTALRKYDGEMAGLYSLLRADLTISVKQLGLVFVPAILSLIPCIYITYRVLTIYSEYSDAEIIYFSALVIASFLIKIIWKIQ